MFEDSDNVARQLSTCFIFSESADFKLASSVADYRFNRSKLAKFIMEITNVKKEN